MTASPTLTTPAGLTTFVKDRSAGPVSSVGVLSFSPASLAMPLPLASTTVPLSDRSVVVTAPPSSVAAVAVAWLSNGPSAPLAVTRTVNVITAVVPLDRFEVPASSFVSLVPLNAEFTASPPVAVGAACSANVTGAPKVADRSSFTCTS